MHLIKKKKKIKFKELKNLNKKKKLMSLKSKNK